MRNERCKKYCKAVAKKLICSKTAKDSFINGLKEELAQFKSSENISEIEAVYGTPLHTAEEFQQNVSAEERAKSLRVYLQYQQNRAAEHALTTMELLHYLH